MKAATPRMHTAWPIEFVNFCFLILFIQEIDINDIEVKYSALEHSHFSKLDYRFKEEENKHKI